VNKGSALRSGWDRRYRGNHFKYLLGRYVCSGGSWDLHIMYTNGYNFTEGCYRMIYVKSTFVDQIYTYTPLFRFQSMLPSGSSSASFPGCCTSIGHDMQVSVVKLITRNITGSTKKFILISFRRGGIKSKSGL
jgi:hypothetical protein